MNKMSLEEAEIWLNQVVKGELADKETIKAIEIVLRAIKIKDEYLKMISFVLTNPYEYMPLEDIVGDIEDAKAYCVMGLNNDDESVIGLNGKKNFNILHEEVKDEDKKHN